MWYLMRWVRLFPPVSLIQKQKQLTTVGIQDGKWLYPKDLDQ